MQTVKISVFEEYGVFKQAPVLSNHFFGFPLDACLRQVWL